ncbi:MAG TPA: hypothetical protein VJL61_14235 [Rhodanobacteraceae bacterium]|nr:hypothetical protein [Rhodanobacteraceae bacterium]
MKLLVVILAVLVAHSAVAADACSSQLPKGLQAALAAAFPAFRVPAVKDNLPEDVQYNLAHSGNGCLGVSAADFDGNGIKDYVVILTAPHGSGWAVVVALSHQAKWQLHKLAASQDGRSTLYVSAERPGKYVRTGALDGPLEHGELAQMTCRNPVAAYGGIESSEEVYCYKGGAWPHVWISD